MNGERRNALIFHLLYRQQCTIYHKTVATALFKALTQWGSHIVVAVKPIWELYNNKA